MKKFKFKNVDYLGASYTFDVSYQESNDPVIKALLKGDLFGFPNAIQVDRFTREQNKSTIIDCGCHIGTFAIPMNDMGRRVLCIDGNKDNIACLNETIKQDRFNEIETFCEILDKQIRSCNFLSSGPFGRILHDGDNKRSMSNTIDNMFHEENDLSFIKYDLEGGEIDAILGYEKVIKKYRPGLLVEVNQHCQEENNKSVYELFELIEDFGYYIIWPFKDGYFKTNKNNYKIFTSGFVTDVVCIPHEEILNYMCPCGECFNISMLKDIV